MAERMAPPPVKLTPEMRTRLAAMDKEIEGAKRVIGTLKKLGMDTRALEEKITWAEEVRTALLTEFD